MAFTPIESGVGGLLIGLSAALAYLGDGKITGISGIVGPFLRGVGKCEPMKDGQLWKALFLVGLVIGGLVNLAFNREFSYPQALDIPVARYCIGGIFVGIGTRAGRGCTSGHGICGLPRLAPRSWIAVPTFMGIAALTVALTRHVAKLDASGPWGVAELQWPPKWEFPLAAALSSLVLAAVATCLPSKARSFVSPLACGIIFGLGLGVSGMTSQAKVLNFLDFAGTWDPSLAFVMGLGLCVSFPAFLMAEREGKKPLCGQDCSFERPKKSGDYVSLVLGATFFGLGWGMVGICPGPALAAMIPYLVGGWGPGLSFGLCTLLILSSWLVTDRTISYVNSRQLPEVQVVKVVPADEQA
ncbi:unnamed protein product [Symbiodinium natans]|uniref:Sulphur transport domain-containing protein n=1 Tax=Symbiodinium natans TaxID=878477 RepID=A0A812LQ85_9DINO|nr:unnamed protein product [Symbiodinium natans]